MWRFWMRMATIALFVTSFSAAVVAAPLVALGGYFPGMSKDAAKKVGLEGCRDDGGRVRCVPKKSISLGSLVPKETSIHFNMSGTFVERIVMRFSVGDVSDRQVQASAEQVFGVGNQYSDSDSSCLREFEWFRDGDERISLCVAAGAAKWRAHYVELKWEPGLGNRLAKQRKSEMAKQRSINSFNTTK